MEHFSHEQIEDYINRFKEHQRQAVLQEIIENQLLEGEFETEAGQSILQSAVGVITDGVLQIVSLCSKLDEADAMKQIYPYAHRVSAAQSILVEWAKILIKGKNHKNNIK